MADFGRITSTIAEAIVTVPSGDAVGRVTSVIGEAIITVPSGDAVGRVSSILAEAIIDDGTDLIRASQVVVEVFSQEPSPPTTLPALAGGIQGPRKRIRSI